MDSTGVVAAGQFFYLGYGHHVVVALDGVLQGRSGHGKFHRLLGILAGEQAVDQAAAIDVSGLGLDAEDSLGIPSCSA